VAKNGLRLKREKQQKQEREKKRVAKKARFEGKK